MSLNHCFHCSNPFNLTENLPRLLPDCGHSLCSLCLIPLLSLSNALCPLCNTPLNNKDLINFPKNLQLLLPQEEETLRLSEISMQSGTSSMRTCKNNDVFCKQHERKLEAFCRLDRKALCVSCLLEDQHRFHEVISLKSAINEQKHRILDCLTVAQNIRENIENSLFEENKKNREKLKESYESSIIVLREFFNKIHGFLNEKQTEIQNQLLFEFQKQEKAYISLEKGFKQGLKALEEFKLEYDTIKKAKDFVIFEWFLKKEPMFEGLHYEISNKPTGCLTPNLLNNLWNHEKITQIHKEIDDFFKTEKNRFSNKKNQGFLGKIKVKGKENWTGYLKNGKSFESLNTYGSVGKEKNKETSFLIEEQRKFHLKMATIH